MANVVINDEHLTNIANAIRTRNSSKIEYKPGEMAEAILDLPGGAMPAEAYVITGDCNQRFKNNQWNWYVSNPTLRTENLTDMSAAYDGCTELTAIPYDLNLRDTISTGYTSDVDVSLNTVFYNCNKLKELPYIKGGYTRDTYGELNMNSLFNSCYNVREIPNDYFSYIGNDDFWAKQQSYSNTYRGGMFAYCYSLRELPDVTKVMTKGTNGTLSLYYTMCNRCFVLDKITRLPVTEATLTTNVFSSAFNMCGRLRELTFDYYDITRPKKANWKNQTIDLSQYVGYVQGAANVLNYNSGLTEDTKVYNSATFQQVGIGNANYWTALAGYSRYHKGSAINTIYSLPDTSEYLATQSSGTNTIKFKGSAGSSIPDGNSTMAISNLSAAEIAVATAKGWTVSIV